MDGSGRIAKRTRQHLRPFKPWDQPRPLEERPEVYQPPRRGPEENRPPASEPNTGRGIGSEDATSTAEEPPAPPQPIIEHARTEDPPSTVQEPPASGTEPTMEPTAPTPPAFAAPEPESTKAPERRRSRADLAVATLPPLRRSEHSTRGKPPDRLSPSRL